MNAHACYFLLFFKINMYENYKQQIHWGIFIACLFFSLISPPYNQEIVQAKPKEKTSTWMASWVVQTVSNTGEVARKKEESWKLESKWKSSVLNENTECWVDCKIKHLENIWIIPEIAESLVTNCKALADDPVRCIKIWAFIVVNESSGWKVCKKSNKYNCFGLSVKENYKSYNDGVLHFIGKYNKYWYKQTSPDWFYSNSPDRKPPTRFCLSEDSSGLPYCKNWHRIAWSVFNKLNKLF